MGVCGVIHGVRKVSRVLWILLSLHAVTVGQIRKIWYQRQRSNAMSCKTRTLLGLTQRRRRRSRNHSVQRANFGSHALHQVLQGSFGNKMAKLVDKRAKLVSNI